MKRAIVIGASSGIGRALAKLLAANGYEVGLAARRTEQLERLQQDIAGPTHIKRIDVTRTEESRRLLEALISEMGGVDLVVISSGVSLKNTSWEEDLQTVEVNVVGFIAMADVAMNHFMERGSGHLVGISSIAGLRGSRSTAATYGASKAFVSNYLEALRLKADKAGVAVHVTDVVPGYVATPMTQGQSGMFWLAPVEVAAQQVMDAIRKKKRIAYITRRWRLMAWLLKLIPYPLMAKIAR